MGKYKIGLKANLARDALIMELFYSGDKIRMSVLARQVNIDKSHVREILSRYYPAETDRDVVMLISSKLNNMVGKGDYPLKEENPGQ